MKNGWWKIPLYSMVAGLICFRLEVEIMVKWAIIIPSDGIPYTDEKRLLVIYASFFMLTVLIGGFFVFRKMNRKDIIISALVMVGIGIALRFIAPFSIRILMFEAKSTAWQNVVHLLVNNSMLVFIIRICLLPFIFVPFGKKNDEDHKG